MIGIPFPAALRGDAPAQPYALTLASEGLMRPAQIKERPIDPNLDEAALTRVYLSDMPESNAKVGYGHFGKHGMLGYRIASGDVITVDNKKYAEAISMAPGHFTYSTVTYHLDGTAKIFRSAIAVNDLDKRNELGPATPLTFKVLGDGALLWRSQPVTKVATTQQFRLNVAGVKTLELQVHCPGRYNNARAVWLDPCVLK